MSYRYLTMLNLIEGYGEANDLIASEEQLSERFDEEVAPFIIEKYGKNDEVAMNTAFNDWTDSLCQDGEIHEVQYNAYCYVGKYSSDY